MVYTFQVVILFHPIVVVYQIEIENVDTEFAMPTGALVLLVLCEWAPVAIEFSRAKFVHWKWVEINQPPMLVRSSMFDPNLCFGCTLFRVNNRCRLGFDIADVSIFQAHKFRACQPIH